MKPRPPLWLAMSLALGACASSPDLVVQPPQLLERPAPVYPLASRQGGEQGTVVLRVPVRADGGLGKAELKTPSGYARLDAAALDSVKTARVSPARTKSGKPADGVILIPFTFKLD
jgi:protein TonB